MTLSAREKTKATNGWREPESVTDQVHKIMDLSGANYTDTRRKITELGIAAWYGENKPKAKALAVKKQDVSAKKASSNFVKPSFMELCYYFEDRGLTEESAEYQAGAFIDYYNSNGWKVSKNPMKDWKAAVRNWIRRS